jgi:signal transduction histidine kinase/ActR/RegA family two-component response regulator
MAFVSEADITREKILKSLMDNVVTNQYDYVMVILGRMKRTNVISLSQREADTEDIHDTNDYDSAVQAYADRYCLPEERDRYLAFMDLKNVWQALETQAVVSQSFCFSIAGRLRYKMLEFYCIDQERELLANVRTDFTDMQLARMEQEEKLREALRQAQQAAIAKDDFLSRMSHDIRTPLNGILGMTMLAQEENTSWHVGRYLEKIDISGHFLLGLVNDILDMSKISAGKLELHPEPYSEFEFVQYIDSVIRPLCEAKGIHFHLPQGSTFCCTIMIDKLKYNQIFFNILSNAVKFTPPGGNVTLKVVNPQRVGNHIESDFYIIDDGIGMSAEFQKRLFQPFEQENTARNDARDGTGLGLAIAKQLVDLMGGTIRVQSEQGKGSTFILHFDFTVVPDVEAEAEPQVSTLSLRGYRILVVEDNEINGEILMAFVEQQGMLPELARNGVEAVGRFEESPPGYFAAVLMDVRMPVMDGLEVTRRIRCLARPDAAAVPILAITANAYADDVRECLEAGMDDHIAKPIEPKVLYEKLRYYVAAEDHVT